MKKDRLRKVVASVLMMALVCASFASCSRGGSSDEGASADEPIIVKYAHTDSESSTIHDFGLRLQELVEEKTDGKMKVELYPNGQLGDDEEMLKSVSMNSIQLTASMGTIGSVAGDQANITELPFLYEDYEDWYTGTFEKGGLDIVNQTLDGTGFVAMDMLFCGFKNIISTEKNMETVDDFNGFKVRTQSTSINNEMWKILKASPTPVPYGEVFTAVSQGMVDGVDHCLLVFTDLGLAENAKYVTLTNHVMSPQLVVTSQQFLDSLPEDLRTIFEECVAEASVYQRELGVAAEEQYIEELKADGVTVTELSQEEREKMRELLQPVYDLQKEASGEELVEAFVKTAGNK